MAMMVARIFFVSSDRNRLILWCARIVSLLNAAVCLIRKMPLCYSAAACCLHLVDELISEHHYGGSGGDIHSLIGNISSMMMHTWAVYGKFTSSI